MSTRTPLGDVELVGGRAHARSIAAFLLAAASVIGALGYVLPAHRSEDAFAGDSAVHSLLVDGDLSPFYAFAIAGLAALLLRKRGLMSGVITGVVAIGGAVFALRPVFLVHLFGGFESLYGEALFSIGVLGLAGGGLILAVMEPLLYVTQRRAVERDAELVLPMARALG